MQNGKAASWLRHLSLLRARTFPVSANLLEATTCCKSLLPSNSSLLPTPLAMAFPTGLETSSPATPLHFVFDFGLLALHLQDCQEIALHFDWISFSLSLCLFLSVSLFLNINDGLLLQTLCDYSIPLLYIDRHAPACLHGFCSYDLGLQALLKYGLRLGVNRQLLLPLRERHSDNFVPHCFSSGHADCLSYFLFIPFSLLPCFCMYFSMPPVLFHTHEHRLS